VAAAKAKRDAVALSAASSAAFAAAAAWAAAGESGSKPQTEPAAGSSHGTTASPMPIAKQTPASADEGQTPATGQPSEGDQQLATGHTRAGQSSAGQAPESLLSNAPAPPSAPGSPGWQAAARPAESPSEPVDQPTAAPAGPSGGSTPGSAAPWLAESELAGLAGAPGRQAPATTDTGRQPPLIIAASSDPPWVERPDEATVAWVPPVVTKGPTDTPWVEPDVYRSEIEVVKPPDELGGPAPSGIICSACGTENDTHRRFCRSCGNPLFAIETPEPEREEPERRSWRWLAILLPVLLIAGVLGFVGAALIRGGLFASASPSPGPAASQPGPGVVLRPSATTASTRLATIWAPGEATDNDMTSSWREGSGKLAGQWIQVTFRQPVTILSITIWAGAQADEDAFKGNLRPRHIIVAADGGTGQNFELADQLGPQVIAYSGPVNSKLSITIMDAYPSTKTSFPKSPTQDCAITELQFNGTMP
jgi:hypothetical protein